MKRISVKSSNVNSVGYDEVTKTLEIEFSSNIIYQYFGIELDKYKDLIAADSIGKYLNKNIKNNYTYKRM